MTNEALDAAVAEHLESFGLDDSEARGQHANKVLDLVHRGDDLGPLEPLLRGPIPARKTLTFVLSEIGQRSAEALSWIEVLLEDEDSWIRHYAIVALQYSGVLEAGDLTARAVAGIEQSDSVAYASLKLLSFGSLQQLETTISHLDQPLSDWISLLCAGENDRLIKLAGAGRSETFVAVAGAARVRAAGSDTPLAELSSSEDETVARIASFIARFRALPSDFEASPLYKIARNSEPGARLS